MITPFYNFTVVQNHFGYKYFEVFINKDKILQSVPSFKKLI